MGLCFFGFDLVTIRFYPFLLHALLSFLIVFSWKRRSINFLHKISLFNGLSDFRERRNRIKCPLGTFFRTVRMNGKMMNGKMRYLDRSENV